MRSQICRKILNVLGLGHFCACEDDTRQSHSAHLISGCRALAFALQASASRFSGTGVLADRPSRDSQSEALALEAVTIAHRTEHTLLVLSKPKRLLPAQTLFNLLTRFALKCGIGDGAGWAEIPMICIELRTAAGVCETLCSSPHMLPLLKKCRLPLPFPNTLGYS